MSIRTLESSEGVKVHFFNLAPALFCLLVLSLSACSYQSDHFGQDAGDNQNPIDLKSEARTLERMAPDQDFPAQAERIVNRVSTFYEAYLAMDEHLSGLIAVDPDGQIIVSRCRRGMADAGCPVTVSEFLHMRDEIDSIFAHTLDIGFIILNAYPQGEAVVDCDPILQAQDVPYSLSYGQPVIDGDRAEMVVFTHWWNSKYPLCVTLRHTDYAWRINGIIDMPHAVTKDTCAGWKRQDFRPYQAEPAEPY